MKLRQGYLSASARCRCGAPIFRDPQYKIRYNTKYNINRYYTQYTRAEFCIICSIQRCPQAGSQSVNGSTHTARAKVVHRFQVE
jgi:hypothetical protein